MIMDQDQDCVIDAANSKISIDYETGLTQFTVSFFRKLHTRFGNSTEDIKLLIADSVSLDWGFRLKNQKVWDMQSVGRNITIFSGAKILMGTISTAIIMVFINY